MIPDIMLAWKSFSAKQIPAIIPLEPIFYEHVKKGSKVLDLGCAWGRVGFQMQEAGLNVFGVDINADAIKKAELLAVETNKIYPEQAKFLLVDALDLSNFPDDYFDAAVMIAFMVTQVDPEHRPKILKEVCRVLKPNGFLYIADFADNYQNPKYKDRYEQHFKKTGEWRTFIVTDTHSVEGNELYRCHHYTKKELSDLVSPGFRIEKIEDKKYFTGNSEVDCMVILARKHRQEQSK